MTSYACKFYDFLDLGAVSDNTVADFEDPLRIGYMHIAGQYLR